MCIKQFDSNIVLTGLESHVMGASALFEHMHARTWTWYSYKSVYKYIHHIHWYTHLVPNGMYFRWDINTTTTTLIQTSTHVYTYSTHISANTHTLVHKCTTVTVIKFLFVWLQVGDAADFIPVFLSAKKKGLKVAAHLAEVCSSLCCVLLPWCFHFFLFLLLLHTFF